MAGLAILFNGGCQFMSANELFLVHQEFNATNRDDGSRMFILQMHANILFLQSLHHEIGGNVIIVCA